MYEYKAKVINVVDGDTIDAEVDVGFYTKMVLRFRLLGVNCPEMHGENSLAGDAARDFTCLHLDGNEVTLRTYKADSFGRWLCEVLINGINFNDLLIKEGYAIPYKK